MSKTINFNNIVNAFSRGNVPISRIYARGNKLVWSKTQSYEDMYLTIECTSGGDFKFDGTWMSPSYNSYDITLYYSKNGGQWTEIHSTSPTTLSAVTGDKFRFKGINNAISPMVETKQTANTFRFLTGDFKAYGNVMSVLFGDNFRNATLTTGINDYAFKDLFNQTNNNNNTLTNVENIILPGVLTPHCFRAMFQNTAISSAPELPATTLAEACYRYMFGNCGSLISAPELPATTLVDYCYYGMFFYCTNLRYIKCSATSGINTNNSTANWVQNVFSTGTFYKDSSVTWPTGNNGIPTTWTVKDIATTIPDVPTITCSNNEVTITSSNAETIYYRVTGTSVWSEYTSPFSISATTTYEAYASNEIGDSAVCTPVECEYVADPYSTMPFTIEFLEEGYVYWKMYGTGADKTITADNEDITWQLSSANGNAVHGTAGTIIHFYGTNDYYTNGNLSSSNYKNNYSYFDITCRCNIYGNIMSLIKGRNNFIGAELTSDNKTAFCSLFKPTNTSTGNFIVDASNLRLPIANAEGCYRAMFAYSKAMQLAPTSIVLGDNGTYRCYYMFQYCTSLITAPTLPSETAHNYDYQYMFTNCTSLMSCTCNLTSPSFTISGSCYRMFQAINTNGTLYKNPNASNWPQTSNAVPTTWSIQNIS